MIERSHKKVRDNYLDQPTQQNHFAPSLRKLNHRLDAPGFIG